MNRREFMAFVGGAAAGWPLAAYAQQPAMPIIGFLNATWPDAYRLHAFHQGLRDAGFVEGENVAIEYRWAENQMDRLPALAAELIRRKVAVIAAGGGVASARAAGAETKTISIVFLVAEDPVKLGLVTSLAQPGGNLTGINIFAAEVAAKRLELLRELLPKATRIAVLVDPVNATTTESTLRGLEAAVRTMGMQVQLLNASTIPEIDAAFTTLANERPDGLFVGISPLPAKPTCSIGSTRGTSCDSCNISRSRTRRSRWTDELRYEHWGGLSPDWQLLRPHPQGRETCGSTGGAVE